MARKEQARRLFRPAGPSAPGRPDFSPKIAEIRKKALHTGCYLL